MSAPQGDNATRVQLDGDGPFLLPFLGADVAFAFGDNVAVMRMRTVEGQEVLLPFETETLRVIGLALADILQTAFNQDRVEVEPDDLMFVERGGAR